MKRIFTVIVVLITLSLLGIIALQVSWFKNLIIVQEEKLLFKVDQAATSVTTEFSKYANNSILKPPFPDKEPYSASTGHFTISQLYTASEVREKLTRAFESNGLKNLEFEFALVANGQAEIQSAGFFSKYAEQDTTNNRFKGYPINTGADMDAALIPMETLELVVVDFKKELYQSLTWIIMSAVLFTIIILAAFYLTVRTLLTQKKLSEIKSDFINNMTHEFKTPLATISLAVDALKNEKVQHDKEKMQYFSGIIKEENKRMNKHVETILQAALMDKQELKLNLKPLHAHSVISGVVDNFRLQLEDKRGKIELTLNAKEDLINADEVHFTNLVSNLIDNAIKYSKEELQIRVYTHCTHKHFIFRVEDNGIGMSKESVKRIFEKFYRAHTGNIHNVKGFGLGMSYVKTVVDAHRGRIKVDSTLGKGSVFTVEVPVVHK
jgi:two-component system phosphate regulon sensor histidine kinase PhoR